MLSKEEVLKIAKLSKLKLSDEELIDMEKSLNEIFEYIKQINEVDVSNVEPLYNVLEIKDRTREDIVKNTEKKGRLFEQCTLKKMKSLLYYLK